MANKDIFFSIVFLYMPNSFVESYFLVLIDVWKIKGKKHWYISTVIINESWVVVIFILRYIIRPKITENLEQLNQEKEDNGLLHRISISLRIYLLLFTFIEQIIVL